MDKEYWNAYCEEQTSEMRNGYYRLVEKSIEAGDITEDFFEYLSELPVENLDDQKKAYKELASSIIQTRMMKGAVYLERTDLTEAQRARGMSLYNQLNSELEQIR